VGEGGKSAQQQKVLERGRTLSANGNLFEGNGKNHKQPVII